MSRDRLTKKEIMSIIRDTILKRPDYKKYGFNRSIIESLKSIYDITVTDPNISKYIKDIEKEWQDAKTTVITKQQIVDHYKDLFEDGDSNVFAKINILREIGKLEGHYVERTEEIGKGGQVVIYNIPDNRRDIPKRPPNNKKPVKKQSKPAKK